MYINKDVLEKQRDLEIDDIKKSMIGQIQLKTQFYDSLIKAIQNDIDDIQKELRVKQINLRQRNDRKKNENQNKIR